MKHKLELTQKQVDLLWELTAYVTYRCGNDIEMYNDFVELAKDLENLTTDVNSFDNHVVFVYDEDVPQDSHFKLK